MKYKDELDKRLDFYRKMVERTGFKEKYNLNDSQAEDFFYGFLFRKSRSMDITTSFKRKLGLAATLPLESIINEEEEFLILGDDV